MANKARQIRDFIPPCDVHLLLLQNSCGLRSHAVDTPISLPVTIADGDGEPTKIAPNHLDGAMKAGTVAVQARHRHVFTFAAAVIIFLLSKNSSRSTT